MELYPTDWRRDSRADSGAEPQALLNEQFVDDVDIVRAIFYKLFGTPTNSYGSGTEEEICRAIDQGKRVLVYFWRPPEDYEPQCGDQLDKIRAFRRKLDKSTLNKSFSDPVELKELVRHDFTKLIFELEGGAVPSAPLLSLVSLDVDGGVSGEGLMPIRNLANSTLDSTFFDDRIKEIFHVIANSPVGRPLPTAASSPSIPTESEEQTDKISWTAVHAPSVSSLDNAVKVPDAMKSLGRSFASYSMRDPVRVSEADQEIIRVQLGELGFEPQNAFFEVGSLCVNKLPTSSLNGSKHIFKARMMRKRNMPTSKTLRRCADAVAIT